MKKIFLWQRVVPVICLLFLLGNMRAATVNWSGAAFDVTDNNILITADSSITGSVTVKAVNQSVSVDIQQTGITRNLFGVGAAPVLYLQAAYGQYIVFNLHQSSLAFKGVSNSTTPLLIVVRGLGRVIFDMCGGQQVSFTNNGAGSGGTQLYMIMNVFGTADQGNILIFQRYASETNSFGPAPDYNQHVFINIGPDSLFGYASADEIATMYQDCFDGATRAIIRFDPSNYLYAEGRMILTIADRGAFIVSGRLVSNPTGNITVNSISRNIPAGCQAVMQITNRARPNIPGDQPSNHHAGLLVANNNKTATYQFLADPWGNLGVRQDASLFIGSFSGIQYGMVLGNNGTIDINSYSYLDYVGLALDACPTGFTIPCSYTAIDSLCQLDSCCSLTCPIPQLFCNIPLDQSVKRRNASALIVDGYYAPPATPAEITMDDRSAAVFRSGVDCAGVVEHPIISTIPENEPNPYIVDPTKRVGCTGSMVFDVEGFLQVSGSGTSEQNNPTKLELLSLEVTFSGAPVLIDGSEVNFPLRTFASNNPTSPYYAYNTGYFFFNNCTELCDTWLVHTDVNHRVFEKDDVNSQPAYVGGETFKIIPGTPRPTLAFSNSNIFVHSSVAFTGVDLLIPNALQCINCTCVETPQSFIDQGPINNPIRQKYADRALNTFCTRSNLCPTCPFEANCLDNICNFVFFYNGYQIDRGTGRQMILGTLVGAHTCNGCTIIDDNAHLDIMQYTDLTGATCSGLQQSLFLGTRANDDTIVQAIDNNNIQGQYANQNIYLGHDTNISIGDHRPPSCSPFNFYTNPTLWICGNFFSFATRGGPTDSPETSDVTGKGGIFVDNFGKIAVCDCVRVNMATMVTKSGSGVINLPRQQVYFDNRIGGADWMLDLSDSNTCVIVPVNNTLSDYTLNWMATKKNENYVPYLASNCQACMCPAVTTTNLDNVPTIEGTIEQFQIKESRLGDPATILVNSGWIRELVFLSGYNSAEAPVAVVAVQNNGRVGIGSAHTTVDSLEASVKLGVNGVTLVANGNGRIILNEDIVIDNACPILKGPNFASGNRLVIDSECCRTLRIKNGGILDLSSFSDPNYTVEISGHVKLVLEPGATIILNGGVLKFSQEAEIVCQPSDNISYGSTLAGLDPYRVKFVGTGTVLFKGCSQFIINNNSFVGVETSAACGVYNTNLTFEFDDAGKMLIGDGCAQYGGAFQVGDTQDYAVSATVQFTLFINGRDAECAIGHEGFLGFGVGIVNKSSAQPNNWTVDATWHVGGITINVADGIFTHNQIYTGSDSNASLLAIGPARHSFNQPTVDYFVSFDAVGSDAESVVRGGGNFVLILPAAGNVDSPINPTVTTIDGVISSRLSASILASKPYFRSSTLFIGDAAGLFTFWKTPDILGDANKLPSRADAGPAERNQVILGYIDQSTIGRTPWAFIVGDEGRTTTVKHTLEIGCVAARLTWTSLVIPRPVMVALEVE